MRRCVWYRNLENEEAMTRVGSQRHSKKKNTLFGLCCCPCFTDFDGNLNQISNGSIWLPWWFCTISFTDGNGIAQTCMWKDDLEQAQKNLSLYYVVIAIMQQSFCLEEFTTYLEYVGKFVHLCMTKYESSLQLEICEANINRVIRHRLQFRVIYFPA